MISAIIIIQKADRVYRSSAICFPLSGSSKAFAYKFVFRAQAQQHETQPTTRHEFNLTILWKINIFQSIQSRNPISLYSRPFFLQSLTSMFTFLPQITLCNININKKCLRGLAVCACICASLYGLRCLKKNEWRTCYLSRCLWNFCHHHDDDHRVFNYITCTSTETGR